jgi:hypothetical protein
MISSQELEPEVEGAIRRIVVGVPSGRSRFGIYVNSMPVRWTT